MENEEVTFLIKDQVFQKMATMLRIINLAVNKRIADEQLSEELQAELKGLLDAVGYFVNQQLNDCEVYGSDRICELMLTSLLEGKVHGRNKD